MEEPHDHNRSCRHRGAGPSSSSCTSVSWQKWVEDPGSWRCLSSLLELLQIPPYKCPSSTKIVQPTTKKQSLSRRSFVSAATMSIIPRSNIFDPFSLDLWDPFDGLFPFSTNSNALISHPRSALAGDTSAFAGARIDWKETPEAHVFRADLPGVKKEEVKVEVEEGRVLQISGERSREQEEKTDTWHRKERSSGRFIRRFRLPENAKAEAVRAGLEDGVLTVTVPKEEVKKPEVKSIEISG